MRARTAGSGTWAAPCIARSDGPRSDDSRLDQQVRRDGPRLADQIETAKTTVKIENWTSLEQRLSKFSSLFTPSWRKDIILIIYLLWTAKHLHRIFRSVTSWQGVCGSPSPESGNGGSETLRNEYSLENWSISTDGRSCHESCGLNTNPIKYGSTRINGNNQMHLEKLLCFKFLHLYLQHFSIMSSGLYQLSFDQTFSHLLISGPIIPCCAGPILT